MIEELVAMWGVEEVEVEERERASEENFLRSACEAGCIFWAVLDDPQAVCP